MLQNPRVRWRNCVGTDRTVQGGLAEAMTRCDVCVREYHRSRSLLEERLAAEYEESEVEAFMLTFDKMNLERIGKGLDDAQDSLLDLPPEKRSIFAIGEASMYAFFEAMNCMPFLRNEEALVKHFDQPFRLVQVNKKIKLPSYVPAMSCFLFSYNQDRTAWAKRNFSQVKRR